MSNTNWRIPDDFDAGVIRRAVAMARDEGPQAVFDWMLAQGYALVSTQDPLWDVQHDLNVLRGEVDRYLRGEYGANYRAKVLDYEADAGAARLAAALPSKDRSDA